MLKLTIVAIFALLLSSSPSSIHALPTPSASSSSTVVGQVPTVTNLQGIVDPQLFQENLLHTFAKYRFVPVVDNATSTLMNGTGSLHSRRVYQKRGQDLPTRIDLGVITREPAIGLVSVVDSLASTLT